MKEKDEWMRWNQTKLGQYDGVYIAFRYLSGESGVDEVYSHLKKVGFGSRLLEERTHYEKAFSDFFFISLYTYRDLIKIGSNSQPNKP